VWGPLLPFRSLWAGTRWHVEMFSLRQEACDLLVD
jgi:hypothetical protein